jgi:hypothetical protein
MDVMIDPVGFFFSSSEGTTASIERSLFANFYLLFYLNFKQAANISIKIVFLKILFKNS